jgi:proline dehydrogenase
MINRLEMLATAAAKHNVALMVDAEQSYMQPSIDHLALNLQRKYNQEHAVIFNTFQCYLKDSVHRVKIDLVRAKREKFKFACKLVRGAYMVQERKRAIDMKYKDPIHDTITDTHENYDNIVELLLDHNSIASFMVASHNEESVHRTTELMHARGIPKSNGGVYFGQLKGMCDHVSFSLGHAGYKVFKYVPYGPVKEVIPYLVRRAEENVDLMQGAGKESSMLKNEIFRRMFKY